MKWVVLFVLLTACSSREDKMVAWVDANTPTPLPVVEPPYESTNLLLTPQVPGGNAASLPVPASSLSWTTNTLILHGDVPVDNVDAVRCWCAFDKVKCGRGLKQLAGSISCTLELIHGSVTFDVLGEDEVLTGRY